MEDKMDIRAAIIGILLSTLAFGHVSYDTIEPDTTNVYDLGTPSKKWRDIYLSSDATINTLKLTGGSITDLSGSISFGNENLRTTGILTLVNSGLHILDSVSGRDLIISPGSIFTSDRTFTIITGDIDRTLTLIGNPILSDWFSQGVKTTDSPDFAGLTVGGDVVVTANFSGELSPDPLIISSFTILDTLDTTTALIQAANIQAEDIFADSIELARNDWLISARNQIDSTSQMVKYYAGKSGDPNIGDIGYLSLFLINAVPADFEYARMIWETEGIIDENGILRFQVASGGSLANQLTIDSSNNTVHNGLLVSGNTGIGTTSPDAKLQVVGTSEFGDDDGNNVAISATGNLTLFGTAKVLRSVDFEPDAVRQGGVGPGASTEDGFPTHDFSAVNDESVFIHWEIPHEYANAGEIHLHVEYFVDTAPIGASTVTWGIEYKKLSIGDNFAFTGTTTIITNDALTTGTPANDKKIHSSDEIHLVTTGFAPMDVVLIRIFRDANASEGGATDDFGSDARVFNYHLMFESDKLGQGT